ncbi:hypothetical protein B0F90DRAFT_1158934 [Multifurca ochricompacta]|uniref:Uncharacterized protein n=1 Tax=Multifurca ochricompacta TaxID=376703 RepID=A0AAD4QQG7_9AGAM|nr:hypothetical protein B0F90DRAFT_1158934 [Multifurca ochricompacta]
MRAQKEAFDIQLQESMEHSLALSDHSRAIISLSSEFEQTVSARLESAYGLLNRRLGEIFLPQTRCGGESPLSRTVLFLPWTQVNLSHAACRPDHLPLVQLIVQLSMSASHLADTLNSSTREVKLIHIAQVDAARASTQLAGTLQRMNETVMSALVDINNTAVRVNHAIGIGFYPFFPSLPSLASAILVYCEDDRTSVDSVMADYLYSEPNFRSAPSYFHCRPSAVVHHTAVLLFPCHGGPPFQLPMRNQDDSLQPCIVAAVSMLHRLLRRIFPRRGIQLCHTCARTLQEGLQSNNSQVLSPPMSSVTFPAPATSWPRRRPLAWRSTQFSRIPDRLCKRFDN